MYYLEHFTRDLLHGLYINLILYVLYNARQRKSFRLDVKKSSDF